MTWLEDMQGLRSSLHDDLREMGRRYRELVDLGRNGNADKLGMHVFFDNERRGIGRGHGLRTEFNEGTKAVIRDLLRTHDLKGALEKFEALKFTRAELLSVNMPMRDRLGRVQEADQEYVECAYYIDFFPVVFLGKPLPEKYQDPDDLGVHPTVFLNGLLDVISELTKSVGDYLLETPQEKFNAELVFTLKGRCLGVCEGLWRFLDEYEYVYGGVINLTKFFAGQYKSKLRRQADGMRRMKESLLEFRERQLK